MHVNNVRNNEAGPEVLKRVDIIARLGDSTMPLDQLPENTIGGSDGMFSYFAGTDKEKRNVPCAPLREIDDPRIGTIPDLMAGRWKGRGPMINKSPFSIILGCRDFSSVGEPPTSSRRLKGWAIHYLWSGSSSTSVTNQRKRVKAVLKKMRLSKYFSIASVASFISALSLSTSQAQLMEDAKKEGKVVWYTSMGVDDSQPFGTAFSKKHPYLKVEVVRASSEKLLNRLLTEVRAGKYLFDVVTLSGFDMHIAQRQDLLGRYVSRESKIYTKGFKDPDGYWTATRNNYYVVGYNTGLVKKTEAPRRWQDLLDLKWHGKFGMDEEEYEWYAGMLEAMGEEKGKAFMHALTKQDIQWRKGHNLLAQLLVAGEFPLALSYAHRIDQQKKRGAPVEWITTTDPIIVSINPAGIGAKAEHPNAAKLFIDFFLSLEGQKLIQSFGRTAAHPDLASSAGGKLPLFPVAPSVADRYKKYIAEFRQIFFEGK
jgi:iron(III) transport system substrate-binding protein